MAKAWPPQLSPDSMRNSDTHSPRLARNFPLHFRGVKIAHLQDDGLLEVAALIRKKIIERGGIPVEPLVDPGRKDNGGAERAASKAAQGRHRVGTLRRQLLAVAVGVAVELGHDVDVDAARHGERPEQRLPALLFRAVRCHEHVLVGRFQGRVRQHPEIAGDLAAVLERRGLQGQRLPPDDPVHEVQIGGDAAGAGVVFAGADGLEGLAEPVAVKLAHLLDEHVIHQGYDGGDAVAGDLQGGVDGEPRAHDGDVKRMGLVAHC